VSGREDKRQHELAFQAWWNEKYFHQTPRLRPLKKLYDAGADLDYVNFVCDCGVLRDCTWAAVAQNWAYNRAQAKSKVSKIPSTDVLHAILSFTALRLLHSRFAESRMYIFPVARLIHWTFFSQGRDAKS
jgi:hypothetical protein